MLVCFNFLYLFSCAFVPFVGSLYCNTTTYYNNNIISRRITISIIQLLLSFRLD